MTIINGLMGIEYISGAVVAASFGKRIKLEDNKLKVYDLFVQFQFIHSIIICFCTVALALLMDPFLRMWLGNQYLMSKIVMILIILDFYVHSMYQPVYVLYGSAGKFKDDKIITIASAIMNLVISLIAVMFLGLPGVIIGTLITDIYIWVIRTYQIVRGYFGQSLTRYSLLMIKYMVMTVVSLAIAIFIASQISFENIFGELIVRAGICIFVPNLISIIFNIRSREFNNIKGFVMQRFRRGK